LNQFYKNQNKTTLLSYGLKENLIDDLKSGKEDCFYLGLYRRYEWIERIIEFYKGIDFQDQDHSVTEQRVKIQRKNITKRLREEVSISS
jgi:hypothetical protein